jgi:hypothetical protein
MQGARVIPLLFGFELSELSGPLSQFQALKVDEQGMIDTLKAINDASDKKTDGSTIDRSVPALWSQLQEKHDAIPAREEAEKHMRPQAEIMEDLVAQVRGLNGRMRDFDPEMMDEMMMSKESSRSGEHRLLMLAGVLRDTMPWISEVLVEAHRELKNASPKQVSKITAQAAIYNSLIFNMTEVRYVETETTWP